MTRQFDDWLKAYVEFTENSEAPELFHFWAGVSAIAACLRRRVWMDMHSFKWTPNFYIILVAPPGISTKSTTMSIAERMLRQLGIKLGPSSMTWQALTLALEESKDIVEHEAFPNGIQIMSALTLAVSELGTMLKTKDGDLIDVLTDMWDGRETTWQHKTKTTGQTSIINPWLNIIGCTTPGWMRQYFPSYMIDGGLTSRMIFLWSDRKRRLIAYPDEFVKSGEFDAMQQRLIADLGEISKLCGPYTLSDGARLWGKKWYEEHWSNRPRALVSDRYGGYLARKQTHIHKLAMVLAAAQRDRLVVEVDELQRAERIMTSLELHMQKVFDSIGLNDTGKINGEVLNYLRTYKEMAFVDLFKALGNRIEKKDLEAALAGLVQIGTLKSKATAKGMAYEITAQGFDDVVEG